MLKVSTLADIQILPSIISPAIQSYITQRFAGLNSVYCSNGLPLLGQFSLATYGDILVAQSYDDVQDIVFEEVGRTSTGEEIIFHALWITNNETCHDVIIPQSLLTEAQRQQLEKELDEKEPLYLLHL